MQLDQNLLKNLKMALVLNWEIKILGCFANCRNLKQYDIGILSKYDIGIQNIKRLLRRQNFNMAFSEAS